MSNRTTISWATATWNPTIGCKPVSDGCKFCYFFAQHGRRHLAWKRGRWPQAPRQYHKPARELQLLPDRLDLPLRTGKPARIFVDSQSDLFWEAIPDEFITRVFAAMALAHWHRFIVLTKRPARMAAYCNAPETPARIAEVIASMRAEPKAWASPRGWQRIGDVAPTWPLPNVWLGTSVEHQAAANERIPLLQATPAAVRVLSCEPLLGPLDLDLRGIHWVITGGESGSHARPAELQWFCDIRDQCLAARVAFHHKQHGGRGHDHGGRLLDGREWNEYPDDPPRSGGAAWAAGGDA
jgi:protein gp37